jgi:subtilisin family serine protease
VLKHTFFKKSLFFFMAVCLTVTVAFADSWIINSKSNVLPEDLEKMVQEAGGKVVKLLPSVGMVIAEFEDESQARGFETANLEIVPDVVLNWLPPNEKVQASNIGEDETFYPYQWHLPVIGADKAWDEGVTGAGVRVAVLDTGIFYTHPDLAGNMDHASSISFVPYEPDYIDVRGHGTHVAGIIAAVDNNWGSIGIAPHATIFAVKVLDNTGSGAYSWIAAGVVHAVLEHADIINMSLGGYLKKSGYEPYYTARQPDLSGFRISIILPTIPITARAPSIWPPRAETGCCIHMEPGTMTWFSAHISMAGRGWPEPACRLRMCPVWPHWLFPSTVGCRWAS